MQAADPRWSGFACSSAKRVEPLSSLTPHPSRPTRGLSFRGVWTGYQSSSCPMTNLTHNSSVTRERWAQLGITVQFLIIIRTLAEIFRLRHMRGASFSCASAMPYVGGALVAACCCWIGATLYFFRRYALSAWIAVATILILLLYKIAVIGW